MMFLIFYATFMAWILSGLISILICLAIAEVLKSRFESKYRIRLFSDSKYYNLLTIGFEEDWVGLSVLLAIMLGGPFHFIFRVTRWIRAFKIADIEYRQSG